MRLCGSCLVLLTFVACGGGGESTPPDASPPRDAASPDATLPPDPTRDYVTEPLAPGELSADEQLAIARQFNPGQVHTNPVVFASPVDYVLEKGAGLMRAPVLTVGDFWMKLDLAAATPVTGIDLLHDDWSTLPQHDDAMNVDLAYYIDTPGDATGPGADEETWTQSWTDAGGPGYTPTQYAHFFWLSRPDGYLGIQYWFFYPWNKFANNHEGDWEHVNVIVKQQPGGAYALVMAHYSVHGAQWGLLPADIVRVADRSPGATPGDHVVVFSGGQGCQMFGGGQPMFCGDESGASFPYPGVYPSLAVPETVGGGTSLPGHARHPNDFDIVLLPRADEPVAPNLSWYKLAFFTGNPETAANANVVKSMNNHRAPSVPNAHHYEFEAAVPKPFDPTRPRTPEKMVVPAGWTLLNDPTTGF
jgi:hypothetical protein